MAEEKRPPQFEYLVSDVHETKISLTGNNLSGELSHSTFNSFNLLPPDEQEQTIIFVRTGFQAIDNSGNFLEAQTNLVVYVYNYQHFLDIEDIYGVICFSTIQNYKVLAETLVERAILYNGKNYEPTVIIPSFEAMRSEIEKVRNKAYRLP